MAESAGGKWEIGELSPPHGSSILAGKAGENLERGEDEPARQNQVIVKSEDESSMAEDAGRKRKSGKTARLTPRLGLVQNSIDFLKRGKDKLARLYQRERKSGEEGPARPYLDAVKADSSMDEYAAIEGKRVVDEPARLNQDMIPREADVILSFRGSDNLFGFVNSLYRRLVADGIRVFIDDSTPAVPPEELRLLVSSSKIYVPIFSVNYARSPRCLDSLALMVEHASKSGGKKEILPVFYDVERSDVQLEKESLYRDALDTHKQSSGDEKVEQWKKALVEAGKIKGWEPSSCNSEGELIKSIVGEISLKLKIEHNYAAEDLSTGDNPLLSDWTSIYDEMSPITELEWLDHGSEEEPYVSATNKANKELEDGQELKIMELLELEVNDVRIVGIHGRDGIGKTALAKIVYDQISLHFDACCFLSEIEETTQQPGGVQYLQTKLIFDILKREYEVASAFKGVRFLKEIFRNMKVLIVLDDVERGSLLKEFVGTKLDWFGSGSRIIVTSKERSILQGFVARGLAHTYDVNPLDDNLAFNFFWQYAATGRSDELSFYVKIAVEIVKAAKGLPLLLKVFGSFLHDKGLEEWIRFKDLIEQFQENYQKILSIIYDGLDQKEKQIYLDIACFTPDMDCLIASYMWPRYYCPYYEIQVLCRMSLIKMEEDKISMHSMLRCHAKEIIRKGFHDPGACVGLYIPATAQDMNKGKKGTDHLNTEEAGLEIPPNTTFLSLGRANIGGQFADALLNVRWLHWQGCPRDAISIHLEKNENLVILDLSWSKVTESWGGWNGIKMERLKVLNLTGCVDLLVTPSFSCCPNLEILILERCSRLVHLDPSIDDLKLLVTLNLKFCSELSMLPVDMGGMNALRELLIDGTSVRELPESIGKLVRLRILSATSCFSLVRVPSSVRELTGLSVLALDNARILVLPESIGDLWWRLRRLSLRDCRGLGKLPESICDLRHSLVELDISGTGISRLLDSTKYLWRLEVLKMDSCFLREFPSYIGELINLEEIHASWCRSLEGVIPSGISELYSLRELRLRGTRISSLPSEIKTMSSLHTLDLLHCDLLKELPRLPPSLTKLYVNPDLMLKAKNLQNSDV